MSTLPPSGEQFEISYGEQRATIVEVGAGVREYVVGERPVLDPYPLQAMCDGGHGAPLIPWPNRIADGRYRFDDVRLPGSADRTRQAQRNPWLPPLARVAGARARTDPGNDGDASASANRLPVRPGGAD